MAYHSEKYEGKTKFIKDDVVAIGKMLDAGVSLSSIARQYGVSIDTIRQVQLHLVSKG